MSHPEPLEILIIDDAPMFRELESIFLANAGRVTTEADGAAGLARAKRERPDVVVVDFAMPELSGIEVCSAIQADPELQHTAVIVVTGGEDPDERARAVMAGADDVLSKPINRVALIQAVNRFRTSTRKGLRRVPVAAPVRILTEGQQARGIARNLSRGGMFVEVGEPLSLNDEVQIHFPLPDTADRSSTLRTTAKVVWTRHGASRTSAGLGLQFLALDRASAERIEDFVYERSAGPPSPRPAAAPLSK